MKKLKLVAQSQNLNLEPLTRDELRKIFGGEEGSGSGGNGNGYFCQCANGMTVNVSTSNPADAMNMAHQHCQSAVVGCHPA